MQDVDPNTPLSDDYLRAHGNDPDIVPFLTSAERRRLSGLGTKTTTDSAPRIPRDQRGMPMVSSDTSDAPNSPLMDMLGPLAHPETLTDFARLLTLPVDSVKKALAGALTMRAAGPAATATAQAVKNAPATATRAVVNGTAAVGDAVGPDVIGVVSPRAGKVVQVAQKLRDARAATAAAEAPPEAVPPTPAATTPPVTPPTNNLPNQKLLNELAIAARRAGVKLTPETEQAAIEAVGKGATPAEAVTGAKPSAPLASEPATATPRRQTAPRTARQATPEPAPAGQAPTKFRLSSAETKEWGRLLRKGKTEAEARALIEAQRSFAQRMNIPSAEQARVAVADRNASGRWPE